MIISVHALGQWDPDAGLVRPYPAKVIADGSHPGAVTDGNAQTKWESAAMLPAGYIPTTQNVFAAGNPTIGGRKDAANIIDGNTGTQTTFSGNNCSISFAEAQTLKLLSVKTASKNPVSITLQHHSTTIRQFSIHPEEAYQLKQWRLPDVQVSKVILTSAGPFQLFEVAGLGDYPKVVLTLDLGRNQPVGWVESKHFAGGTVRSVKLYAGTGNNKRLLASLNPKAIRPVITRFEEQPLRFLTFEYQLSLDDYSKAFLWEVKSYNRHGPYGPMPVFKRPAMPLKNVLGINTFWGWGHQKPAGDIPQGLGPGRFQRFIQNVRYYHNLDWDIARPGMKPDFKNMPGSLNQPWLDWDREYLPIWQQGFNIQATLQIPHAFHPNTWDSVYLDAKKFGAAFAGYFGKHPDYRIEAVEIGNEPWKYGPVFYRQYLEGMASGISEAAPGMKILPCALAANRQQPYLDNYIGEWLQDSDRRFLDGLNVHLYSYTNNAQGRQIAVHPEHPESEMRGLLNMLRFRDKNMPGKEVQVTEWGWDSYPDTAPCDHLVCVSETAQAAYAVRAMLMFYRLGAGKIHWYFFADEDKEAFRFTRSGLLTSPQRGMHPKPSYYALKSAIAQLGNLYLQDIHEGDDYWKYTFGAANGKASYMVVWIPEKHQPEKTIEITLWPEQHPVRAFLPDKENTPVAIQKNNNGGFKIRVGTYPVIVELL